MLMRSLNIIIALTALSVATDAVAEDDKQPDDIKQLKGISIVGDEEAPRSLYIVPWHTAEYQQNTSLSSGYIDNDMQALDRSSFLQQLRLLELSKSGWYRISGDTP